MIIQEMQHCIASKPPWVRIVKWRLTLVQASYLAAELYAMQLHPMSTQGDLLCGICDGSILVLDLPIEVAR